MIGIYDKNCNDFNNNGLAVLNNCLSVISDEVKNGQYELELEYPFIAVDRKIQYFVKKNIIKADGQLFRIYDIEKNSEENKIKIKARHITYDANDDFLEDIRAENATCEGALIKCFSQLPKFNVHSDIAIPDTAYFVEESPIEALFNKILPRWGGELQRDNYNISILQSRGLNRGVFIKAKKNIKGVVVKDNTDSMVTRIYAKGYDGLTLPEKYVTSPNYNIYQVTKKVEFPEAKTVEELRAAANEYLNKVDMPIVNIKVSMVDVSTTTEYKNYKVLETVYLCDWVNFEYKDFNIDRSEIQVIRVKKDLLKKVNLEIELGQPRKSLFDSLSDIENNSTYARSLLDNMLTADNRLNPSFMAAMISLATTQIRSEDGHVLMKNNAILIMDTDNEMTAQKVWKWSAGGLGYSKTGVNGPFPTAITADGKIVADFIVTGHVKGGYLDINLDEGTVLIGRSTTDYLLYFDGTKLSLKNVEIESYLKSLDFETYKTQTAQSISSKVSTSEVSTLIAQNPASVEIALKNINNAKYQFTDNGLILKNNNNQTIISADGIMQCDTVQLVDNVDSSHPLTIKFYVDDDVISIRRIKLNFTLEKFRAYEKGMNSGGNYGNTTTSGGGITKTSGSSGAYFNLYLRTDSTNLNTGTSTDGGFTSYAYDTGYGHSHTLSTNGHSHSIGNHDHTLTVSGTAQDHSHSIDIPNHQHSFSIPSHYHDIIYGIYEDTTATNVDIYVDGQKRAGTYITDNTVDLTSYITTKGWHTIEITSSRLGRINAGVYVKSYVSA